MEQDLRCSGCGHPRDETTDPASERHWHAEAVKCHACAARDHMSREFTGPNADRAGLLIAVHHEGG